MKIILASGSPRRRELLQMICENYEVISSDVDEQVPDTLSPAEAAATIARRKAQAVFVDGHGEDLVIGADTIVILDGKILGKPHTPQRAAEMLRTLSGRVHTVYTAVQVFSPMGERNLLSETQVYVSPMSETEIAEYVSTGEPLDKAGAYGIQGLGSRYISRIEGDYFTVMGLPVNGLYHLLQELL